MADKVVDARGLQCPMPVIKVAQGINEITSGQTLEVIATDNGALSDIPSWSKDMGHSLKEQFSEAGEHHFIIEKS
ncbi:MAG: sulfurtransferase TusA family protein [Acidimicrobiia bacterium]|nr:sulfurtransferase TusA family protein [Acidimicrobiia bacterium]MDH5421371.1 sulfurtransferase TusA family protein [Acidimicrobiia bacterium]MDH5504427.1 sulfurtransferase TusA family protein [Acidimicrobiia bacterium]